MGKEIERKFLLNESTVDLWNMKFNESFEIVQGYFPCHEPTVRVRTSSWFNSDGYRATLTMKSKDTTITRYEFEYPIPIEDAKLMIAMYCGKRIIRKIRRVVKIDGLNWEIDCYLGNNDGLFTVEVELKNEEQVIQIPDWVGEEITDRPEYTNHSLAIQNEKIWNS